MAAPTYRGAGGSANQFGTTSVTITAVSGNAQGDVLIIPIESTDSATAAGTPNTPSDWGKIFEQTFASGVSGQVSTLTVFARIAPVGGSGDITVDGVGDHCGGRMFAVTAGTHGVANVLTDIVVGTAADHGTGTASLSTPSITVTADSLIFGIIGLSDDANDTTNASGYTNANLASITERTDGTSANGAGGGIAVWTATCAGTSTGATTWAHDTAVQSESLHIGIRPVVTTISSTAGNAEGTATAAATAVSISHTVGNAAGAATAAATAYAISNTVGAAQGSSDPQAAALAIAHTTGNAEGTATLQAVSQPPFAIVETAGNAAGTSDAQAVGLAEVGTVGNAEGTSDAQAALLVEVYTVGNAEGTSDAQGVFESPVTIVETVGNAEGISDAQGVTEIVVSAATAASMAGNRHRRRIPRYIFIEPEEEGEPEPVVPFKPVTIAVMLPRLTSFEAGIEAEYVQMLDPAHFRVKQAPSEWDEDEEWLLMH